MEKKYIDWTKVVPTEPPKELIPWLRSHGYMSTEYIIYSMDDIYSPYTGNKERMVKCKCSACGGVFYAEKASPGCSMAGFIYGWFHPVTNEIIKEYENVACPLCESECKAYHIWKYGDKKADVEYPMCIMKLCGKICLVSYHVEKYIDKEGRTTYNTDPYEAYIFDGKKCIKLQGYTKFQHVYYNREWEARTQCRDTYGEKGIVMSWDKKLLEGTELENSKLDIYFRRKECYPVTYLRIYQRHSNVENLVMAGAAYLVDEKIKKASSAGYYYAPSSFKTSIEGVNWKCKKPHEMLSLSKEEFKKLVKEEKYSDDWISLYGKAKVNGIIIPSSDMAMIKRRFPRASAESLLTYVHIPAGRYFLRAVRYIVKQQQKYSKDNVTIGELTDYWDMMRTLGEELSRDDVIFPQRLKVAHDLASDRIAERESREKNERIHKRFFELRRFSYQSGDYLIFPAQSYDELVREGKELHHCVATYADKVSRGDTAIFLIRKKTKPKEPFYTLELNEKDGSVRQNRGLHNCEKTKAVQEFEDAFIERVREMLKKEKKKVRKTA